jgi:hypothetical protein
VHHHHHALDVDGTHGAGSGSGSGADDTVFDSGFDIDSFEMDSAATSSTLKAESQSQQNAVVRAGTAAVAGVCLLVGVVVSAVGVVYRRKAATETGISSNTPAAAAAGETAGIVAVTGMDLI